MPIDFIMPGVVQFKNLVLNHNVILTSPLIKTLSNLDSYFEGVPTDITSGYRDPEHQLKVIIEKVKAHNIDELYPEFSMIVDAPINTKVKIDNGDLIFFWQRAWSKLLNIGEIINPPLAAEVLFSYKRPGSDFDKKGTIIEASPHTTGHAVDLGGGDDIHKRADIVQKARLEDRCFIKSHLIEPVNNCVHIDVL